MSDMKHGMVQGCEWMGETSLLVCCPSVIANLPRDLCPCAGDSCSWCCSRSSVWQLWLGLDQCKCWVIMCTQPAVSAGSCHGAWHEVWRHSTTLHFVTKPMLLISSAIEAFCIPHTPLPWIWFLHVPIILTCVF